MRFISLLPITMTYEMRLARMLYRVALPRVTTRQLNSVRSTKTIGDGTQIFPVL